MRQVISWRFVASIGALVALTLFVNVAFVDRGHDRRGRRAVRAAGPARRPRRHRPRDRPRGRSRCRRPVCTEGDLQMTLVPEERTARVFAGTPGEITCPDLDKPCVLLAETLGDTIMWFALVPLLPNFQFELPAIESLDGGYANLVNGWQVPYAPVIDRSRCEEKYPAESFSEFLRLAGADHRADLQPRPERDHPRRLLRTRSRGGSPPRAGHPLGHVVGQAVGQGPLVAAAPRRASSSSRSRSSRLTMRLVPASWRRSRRPARRRWRRARRRRRPGRRDRWPSAVGASIRRLVNISSLAAARPTRSGRRIDIPHTGTRPHWPWVSPSVAVDAATSRSQASASSRPPVKQWPRSLAIVGCGRRSRASTVSGAKCGDSWRSPSAIDPRSWPAQNERPAPGEHDAADRRVGRHGVELGAQGGEHRAG